MKTISKISYLILGIALFTFIGLVPITAHAEEIKNLSIPFQKDYKVANFTFTFEDEQYHHITITAPDGASVSKDSDQKVVEVSVYDIVSGTYAIEIRAAEPITVAATVEGVTGTVKEVGEVNISVTSVISGLKKYYIDGDLCLEWDDTGLGSMNVKVTNPATMQVIASDTIDGTFYRTPIDSKVENVEIYIVPSSEARLYGAGITYTIPVIREIAGSVEVPNYTLTNIETVKFNASVQKDMRIKVTENGDTVLDTEYAAGDYEIEVPINGINNDFVVTLIELDTNNQATYSFNIIKDMVAPTLSFDKTYDNLITNEETLVVSGQMKSGDILYINNYTVPCDDAGRFTYEIPLVIGENTVAVCAADNAGNEFPVVFKVTRREVKESNPLIFLCIGSVVVFFILFVLVIVKVVSMKKNKKQNPDLLKKDEEKKDDEENDKSWEFLGKGKPMDGADIYRKGRKRFEILFDIAPMFVFSAVLLIIFVGFLRIAVVSSGSMEPTLKTGSVAFFYRLAYSNKTPERGDIILFKGTNYSKFNNYLTKRVVGVPGDEIVFYSGDVYINGAKALESYVVEGYETNSSHTFIVPENSVFVLGDNRENSIDSRFFENPYVSYEDIKGKYFGSFYVEIIKKIFIKDKKN